MHVLAARVWLRMLMAHLELAVICRGGKERFTASISFVGAEQCLVLVIHYFGIEDTPVATVFKPAVRIWAVGTGVIVPLKTDLPVCRWG